MEDQDSCAVRGTRAENSSKSVGMWRDYTTPDSDDEGTMMMDNAEDLPFGGLMCEQMNHAGEKMSDAARDAMPHVLNTVEKVEVSARKALNTAEKVGISLSDAAGEYFGALDENDQTKLEMTVIPLGIEEEVASSDDNSVERPLRPLLCAALMLLDRGMSACSPAMEKVEKTACECLQPVENILNDVACDKDGGVGSSVFKGFTDMTMVMDALMRVLSGPANSFEKYVAQKIKTHLDQRLQTLSRWGDRKAGIKHHV
eukprot:CAMPEP_0181311316 /NCGR_PEP_ID=MMETSP1101-20121128/13068_1 /TAXON_ID=46948 /ORGANISM="Rhodomonas abbreviata, Strain Caron Lab Isolate" /LENGTH=256 /DNA_ID=CAMNT_0023418031 /DNA_START=50 /DNA_END=820 /DNA_ORIENTATION=+